MTNSRNSVLIESTDSKSFASMLDWPGWSRSAKTEADALATLEAYADRYRQVIHLAGLQQLPASFEIVDRIPGNGATSFGVPDHVHAMEYESISSGDAKRLIEILQACRSYFDDVRARVSPELRKGPRGGGRDRDDIVIHTLEADRGYARRIGVRTAPFDPLNEGARADHLEVVDATLLDRRDGHVEGKDWPMRYAIRRMAWHILDHAWELEDKDLS